MSNDILKDYFSQVARGEQGSHISRVEGTDSKDDFEQRLRESLRARIIKLERRRRITSIILGVASAMVAIMLTLYFVPLEALRGLFASASASSEGSLLTIQTALCFIIILIGQYLIDMREIKRIRRKLIERQ